MAPSVYRPWSRPFLGKLRLRATQPLAGRSALRVPGQAVIYFSHNVEPGDAKGGNRQAVRNFSSFRAEPANVELQSSGAILARLLRGGFWEVLRCAKEEYETARRNTASISFFMSEISLSRLSGRDGHILHTLQPGERGTSVRRPVKGL